MQNKIFLSGLSFLLFMVLLRVGVTLAELKPLWNDELYSQVFGIEKLSYGQILAGAIPEGNNCPLFYVLQKVVCDVTGYHFPQVWKGEWNVSEPNGQFILRLMPNLFMSLAVAAIFYFFSVGYSPWAGIYAFFTAMSSVMVWVYWVEARPYALWFFLTVLQCLFYLQFSRQKIKNEQHWVWLGITNLLLSLAVVFGVVQVLIVSILLYMFHEKELTKYFFSAILPLGIGSFYYFHSPKYNFILPRDWASLIFDNVPLEWLLIVSGFGVAAALGFFSGQKEKAGVNFGIFTGATLTAVLALIGILGFKYNPHHESFEISSRYFVFLAAVGTVGVSLFSIVLFRHFAQSRWMKLNLAVVLGGLLLLRLIRTYAQVTALGVY